MPTRRALPPGLPKLRGHLEVWEESGGLFSSSWKRRYYVLDRKTKQLLFYPETMEQALGNVDMSRIAMIGPTGDGWVFQLMVEMDHDSADDMRNVTGADEIIDGKPYKRTLLRARSHEEMAYWVDGLIRWVDVFRTSPKSARSRRPPSRSTRKRRCSARCRRAPRRASPPRRRAAPTSRLWRSSSSSRSSAPRTTSSRRPRSASASCSSRSTRRARRLLRSSGGGRLRSSTIQGDDDADESVKAPAADDKFCMRPVCAAQRDELRHATLALQETQGKLDRTLEDIAARDAAAADAAAAVAATAAAKAPQWWRWQRAAPATRRGKSEKTIQRAAAGARGAV
jgi:hypothetical protein